MGQIKAERVASLAEKFCINGHKGDWIARTKGAVSTNYCATCAKESIERHRERRAELGSAYQPIPRRGSRAITTKQQAEERWARSVLGSAPEQMKVLYTRLKELSELIQEANAVVQKTTDDELLAFAFRQIKEASTIFDKVESK